jgi:hypothetical protein
MSHADDTAPTEPHASAAEGDVDGVADDLAFETARLAAGEDVDGTATLPGVHSASAVEKAGTGDDPDDLGSAPDPADADVASDEYPERPRTPGLTSDDSGA